MAAMSHVVSGLLEKRAEVAGLLKQTEREIARMKVDLNHLGGTIRIFAPDLAPGLLRAKEIHKGNGILKPGELARYVLDTLRESPAGMTVRELTDGLLTSKGLEAADAAPWQAVSR